MADAPPMLDAPEIVAVNAHGRLTGPQRHALGRDLYREQWQQPAASLGWLVLCAAMLAILLPVSRDIVPQLLVDNQRGSAPVAFGNITVTLPFWALLKWGVVLFTLSFVVGAAVQVKQLAGFLRRRHALLNGRAVSGVGEVWHLNGQPHAIFGGRQLRPWDARALAGVAPGRYRFFLLPRFGWLLSAQRLRDGESVTAAEDTLAVRCSLSAVNGFDPAALPDNRAGRLTPGQARWVRNRAPDIGWRTIVVYGFAIACGVIVAGGAAREAMQVGFAEEQIRGLGAGLAWVTIWLAILARQFMANLRQKRDAQAGQVYVYVGVVHGWEGWRYHNSRRSNTWIYRYVAGNQYFAVSQAAFLALASGFVHRVYYMPESKHLVNIEFVSPSTYTVWTAASPYSPEAALR